MKVLNLSALSIILFLSFQCSSPTEQQSENTSAPMSVIAYYYGDSTEFKSYPVDKLTHIIYSFLHLKGNQLAFDKPEDSITIKHLVGLKEKNPNFKVLLSLGGWGGCETCSEVFATAEGRTAFAQSVKQLLINTNTDGIDLDWEYPAIEGLPGHRYVPEDKPNFTLLVKALRQELGDAYEISFAAGGYTEYLEKSIEWPEVMAIVDRVNLMSYDLTNGYSTTTGHHTPLYSTPVQLESTDRGVRFLDSVGVPTHKIVIGAAFYARIFNQVDSINNGLNRPCKFKTAINFKDFNDSLYASQGFVNYWDSIAQAPYAYSASRKEFATFDNKQSIGLKTRYVLDKKLGGIMFWQLSGDEKQNGLLEEIVGSNQ